MVFEICVYIYVNEVIYLELRFMNQKQNENCTREIKCIAIFFMASLYYDNGFSEND